MGSPNRLLWLLDTHVFAWLKRRQATENWFLLLVPVTGLVTGLASVLLIRLMEMVQALFWGARGDILAVAASVSPTHRVLALTAGGAVVGLLLLLFRDKVQDRGTAGIIEAITREKGYLSSRRLAAEVPAIVLTVGSGGSLGREGCLVHTGATLGSWLGRRVHLAGNRLNVLVGCGFAAGISAAYNAPIGGALFALEVILGNFALESFGPIVVASAMGTVVSRLLISAQPAYHPPPAEVMVSGWEIGHHLTLGILIGLGAVLFISTLQAARSFFARLPLPIWIKPVLGFALVGAIGIRFPQVFGNGFGTVDLALRGAFPLALVLVLPLVKAAATAITRGSGGAGGIFTPTLFVGAMMGSAYGTWIHALFPNTSADPGAYALVGMGAMLAGTTQAPLTAILMIFELTGDYPIILPLMLACTTAILTARLIGFESIYTQPLRERGVRLGGRLEELVMDRIRVGDLMRRSAPPVRESDSLAVVVRRFKDEGRKELFVVDDAERLRGSVTIGDLSEYLGSAELMGTTRAVEVMYRDLPLLQRDDRLSDAIGRWAHLSRDRLPVVDGKETQHLVGELSSGDIFSLYNQEVLHRESRLAGFVREHEGERPATTFVELPSEYVVAVVTIPDAFAGATIADLKPRARFGVNILEVRRRTEGVAAQVFIVPEPTTELKGGDRLIVVGREKDIAQLGDPLRFEELLRAAVAAG
ncbi:MAG TPA: chloride channel protein [Candidatus Polarisedimenticolaceae bacterium]|nr:chloride channel protein [Candidatus Polarisedimenticolaceae bacterium]